MGIIASVTPGTKHSQLVPRKKVNPDDQPTPHKFGHRACLLHQQQQCATTCVFTIKSSSGRELLKPWQQKNGDGRLLMDCFFLS